ncbi:hypothetical protein B0H14DRAFT_2592495 [Mycena olivaceomarginata]|nr:hypothetical protein B0H14DRAFT_2592495 [Mycena olivaceomarginata]
MDPNTGDFKPPQNRVICRCAECLSKKAQTGREEFVDGQWVSYSTRNRHAAASSSNPTKPLPLSMSHWNLQHHHSHNNWLAEENPSPSNPKKPPPLANMVLKALQFILSTLLGLEQTALDTQLDRKIKLPEIHLPQDNRTAFNRHFENNEPKLIRTPCCPKCFTLYDVQVMPNICDHRDCYIRVGKGWKYGRPERRKGRKDGEAWK